MKKTIFLNSILLFMIGLTIGLSQETIISDEGELLKPEAYFDFWVGSWEATWDEGDGKTGIGTNEITKILDGTVIQETFQITKGESKGFKGTSISVYRPDLKRWKQAWADNKGGYYDFTGEFPGNKRIFQTTHVGSNGKQIIMRMVFKDIKKNTFIWDWESSEDRGNNWSLKWRISYQRINKDKPAG
ncbi:MAG: hypothetical protein AAFX53_15365 [Bacteroidota bacterium]